MAQRRGLVPEAILLACDVLGGADDARDIAEALLWATRMGAQVAVMPFGRLTGSAAVARAVALAAAGGVALFAAAGNLGPENLTFPAWLPEVAAVTAVGPDGVLPECSARADLAAPGDAVEASGPDGTQLMRGSSPAAVLAAGHYSQRLMTNVMPTL